MNREIRIYTYDDADNITGITSNTSPHSNDIGGSVENSYAYDSLYRLIQAGGGLRCNRRHL